MHIGEVCCKRTHHSVHFCSMAFMQWHFQFSHLQASLLYSCHSYINGTSPDATCQLYILDLCCQIWPNTLTISEQSDVLFFTSLFHGFPSSLPLKYPPELVIEVCVVKSRYLSGKGYNSRNGVGRFVSIRKSTLAPVVEKFPNTTE